MADLDALVFEAVQRLLTVGDHAYLQGLSRTSFLEAVENELRFLGLYAHGDRETPEAIHIILEQHLDQWRKRYLEERENAMSSTQQATPAMHVQITESSLIYKPISVGLGIPLTKGTSYLGFTSPVERARIDVSPIHA